MLHSEIASLDKYGVQIIAAKPWRDGHIIISDKGRYHFKKSAVSVSRINFIHNARLHLNEHGLRETDNYLCTLSGEPFVLVENYPFTMTFLPEGRECNFEDETDVIESVKLLAKFHQASCGFKQSADSVQRDEFGKTKNTAEKRLDEIKKFYKNSIYGKNEFEKLFNQKACYFINISEQCIQLFKSKEYEICLEKARQESYLSHHDLTYQNIIVDGPKYFITNFDSCCFDLKVYDLANLIRRKMRKCDWDVKWGKIMLDEYRKIEHLTFEDLYVLKILLMFPQKLWRVINRYNNSNHMWSQKFYIQKLKEVLDEIPSHKIFIDNFDEVIC
jgi:CotS family spore coat protein